MWKKSIAIGLLLTGASTFAAAFDGVDRLYLLLSTGHVDVLGALSPVVDEAIRRKADGLSNGDIVCALGIHEPPRRADGAAG